MLNTSKTYDYHMENGNGNENRTVIRKELPIQIEISELENYFLGITPTNKTVQLNKCSTIIDCSLFIESHFATVNRNNGNKIYLPYLKRLQELKQILTLN